MNTIPTALIIIAALSLLLLGAVLTMMWALGPDKPCTIEEYPNIGLIERERVKIFVLGWLAPTAAAVAGWMVWG